MKRIFLVLVVISMAACSPQQPDTLPTLMRPPSDTPTQPTTTATITLTPSITLTYTPSETPTNTPTATFTPSDTFTPTNTYIPTWTPLPSASPSITRTPSRTPSRTFTPTSTFTPTFTPSITLTPLPTATFTPTVLPLILVFTSDFQTVPSGGTTTLRWQTQNASAITLEQLDLSGKVVSSQALGAEGTRTVTLTANGQVTFRLVVRNGRNTLSRSLVLTVQCATPFFFQPTPTGCPVAAAVRGAMVFQTFERGIAFYVPARREVYLLHIGDFRVNAYPVDYNFTALPILNPPSGLLQPQAEIGFVFAQKSWSDGGSLIDVIGWATAPPQGFDGIIQQATANDYYIRRPDGAVYKLALAGTGTWSVTGAQS